VSRRADGSYGCDDLISSRTIEPRRKRRGFCFFKSTLRLFRPTTEEEMTHTQLAAEPAPDPFAALMEITRRPPVVFTEGRGSWLRDTEGRDYLDFVQGWAVNCLGHCPDVVAAALRAQAEMLINCSPSFYNAPMVRLAGLIAQHSGLQRTFFCNSGAEAVEGAIKLARKWGQKHRNGAYEIITMAHGFHGRTLAAMSASGKPHWETLFEPKVPGFAKVPLNDLERVEQAITDKTVAVMLEPIQGEAGVLPASDEYLRDLRALTRRQDLLLILDEIQTGIGRTGEMFAFTHAGIAPDIMTLGKGLGAGLPLAALVADERICCFEPGDQGGTFNGNALVTAVGCAVMEEIAKPGFLPQVRATGDHLWRQLERLAGKHGLGGVRGRGLLLALGLGRDIGPAVAEAAFGLGLLINAPRPDSLRFMPALNVTVAEIDLMIDRLDRALVQSVGFLDAEAQTSAHSREGGNPVCGPSLGPRLRGDERNNQDHDLTQRR
jgi:acetylornithine/N-succinyldiaminopimelate aminotransferase